MYLQGRPTGPIPLPSPFGKADGCKCHGPEATGDVASSAVGLAVVGILGYIVFAKTFAKKRA